MMSTFVRCAASLVALTVVVFCCTASLNGQDSKPLKYVPPELQASDPEVKGYLDSADKASGEGKYAEALQDLRSALDLASRKGILSDKALVESLLGAAYFVQGNLAQAKQNWAGAFNDSVASGNLVLQADTLVALSAMAQADGNIAEAVDIATRALNLARKSQNYFIQSRCLGELGRLQLTSGRSDDARATIEEALQIDRLNKFKWEASHLLYMAWVKYGTSQVDEAVQLANSARELAIKQENYLVFMQASEFLGQAYVAKGDLVRAIGILEHSRDGVSDSGGALFQRTDSYRAAVAQPYPKIVFLEGIALAYQSGKRTSDALRSWQDLYDTATSANFPLAAAEAADSMARIYAATQEPAKAIAYYALAADAWAKGGNVSRRIDSINSEAFLLQQHGESEKAIHFYEQLVPLLDAAGNHARQFLIELSIAEVAKRSGDLDRVRVALQEAESLLSPDLTLSGVEPKFVFELYTLEAIVHQSKKEALPQMIAMEKAVTAEKGATNDQRAILDREMRATLESLRARAEADNAYAGGDLTKALPLYEMIQYYEETHAHWSGQKYNAGNDDPVVARVLDIPFKLILRPDGAAVLESNLQQMGPIAWRARLPILFVLSNYYFSQGRTDLVVKFATLALPQLRLGENDQPHRWDVQLACELTASLLIQKDVDSAVQHVGSCLQSAQKLGDSQLLSAAHQTRVFVMNAAGRSDEAQDSARFLTQNAPEDPQYYVQLAQLKTGQGLASETVDAWTTALRLFDARKDQKGVALAQMGLANSLIAARANQDEILTHLQAALTLFRRLGDVAGQARVNVFLGNYFAQNKDVAKAIEHLDNAIRLAHQANESSIQAWALSSSCNIYRNAEKLEKALDCWRNVEALYHSLNDLGNEANAVQNEGAILEDLHKPDESLQTYLRAKRVADTSNSWLPRYWIRRVLAEFYEKRGDYEIAITELTDARAVADASHQSLNSAWASLMLAETLTTVGARQDALDTLNLALPIFRELKDVQNEAATYLAFMEIYGARESELKDLDKALEFYQAALRLAFKNDPSRAASLNLDAVEIHWQRKAFKQAESLAEEALDYYQRQKDDWGQASALISLAEIQRSEGDLKASAAALSRAAPLVKHSNNFYITGRFHYGLAQLHKREGRFQEAVSEYQTVIQMLEQIKSSSDTSMRSKVANTYGFIYDELIDTLYQLGEQQPGSKLAQADLALQQAELNKSRIFTTSWGRAFVEALRRDLPVPLQQRERALSSQQDELRAELVRTQSGKGTRTEKQIQADLKTITNEFDAVARELRKISPAYAEARFPEIVTIQSLPLRPGETFVEFKMLDDALLVWMIEGTQAGPKLVSFYKVEHPRTWFEERIMTLRDAFNRAAPDAYDPKISEDLFNALFPDPVARRLISSKAILFVPDDILFLLPLELLSPQAAHSQFVLLQMPTSYFPSAAALRLSRNLEVAKGDWQAQFFGMADPITSADDERYAGAKIVSEVELPREPVPARNVKPMLRGPLSDSVKSRDYFFSRLPDTATEVKNIAALFPSESSNTMILTGIEATKRELLETDLGRFRFVHFATHGFFPVEPGIREPALILSYDGKDQNQMMLSLSEVVRLKLRADMVVLSACNTGSGKVTRAEGVSSLGTAFLAAGASSVAMSLWKVSDKSTAIFMEEFYRGMLRGMPKAAALAAARSALVSKGYSNPFYWAPFVLTGE